MELAAPQLAIVTGAGSGIGRATAERLAVAGYTCVLASPDVDALDDTMREIDRWGGRAVPVQADVTTDEGRAAVLDVADARPEPLLALVNQADDPDLASYVHPDVELRMCGVQLDVDAAAVLSEAVMARMRDSGRGGAIVNVNGHCELIKHDITPCSQRGNMAVYDGKETPISAVQALSKELANAGGPMGVRVNTVCTGYIAGDTLLAGPEFVQWLRELMPLGRVGRPDDVARVVFFLLSTEADYVTGVEIVVDGGWEISRS